MKYDRDMRGAPGGAGVVDAGVRLGDHGTTGVHAWAGGPVRGLRVLHVVEAFGGGILEMLRLLCDDAVDQGHHMAIAFARRPETPPQVRPLFDPRVELFELDWDRGSRRSHFTARQQVRRIADAWRPDVVHLHSSFAAVVGVAAFEDRLPTILTPHAFASQVLSRSARARRVFEVLERGVCRRVTVVGAVSHVEARRAERYGANDVVVIPNGIRELDSPRIDLDGSPAKARPPRTVGVGRLVEQRQPHVCARILSRLRDLGDVEWLGGGGASPAYAAGARAALTASGVPVSGWLAHDDLMRRLGEATAYLHWTTWDGLALSVLEAMALDVVVVASRTDPSCELLPDGQCVDTEEQAVALLRDVLADPVFAEELREAQRARRGRYSAQRMTAAWLLQYAQLTPRMPVVARAPVRVLAA